MIKLLYIGILFASVLGIGLLGIGAYMLLPKSIRNKINNLDN